MYTIVDIETTGNGILGNKITEIAIFKYDGNTVIDEFTSLVNPECEIPYFITSLTGIDNQMVRNAPTFREVVDKIDEITTDTIFVAHSVNFDYNVIKNEFTNLGREFVRKKLCTVRLSRKLLPGYHSYSLGKLCSALEIPLTDRHRARGDAHATVLLFQKLLATTGAQSVFKSFLNARSQEATLPPSLPRKAFEQLPELPGIYIFKNAKGAIIYIGKAINIKKRVLSHFYNKSTKEVSMCQEITAIDFELSGSELVALLMESDAIKTHYPPYNRAQKKTIQQYAIFSYEDRNGIMHLAHNKVKAAPNPLKMYYSITACREAIEELCKAFKLCPKYCHLQEGVAHCSHHSIGICAGICTGAETTSSYNAKVTQAIKSLQTENDSFVFQEKGRVVEETAFIWVEDGRYAGYGFVPEEETIHSYKDLDAFLIRKKNTHESQRIVQSYLAKHPYKEKFPITEAIL